ncbi:LysR family transcriptional regulator [Paraburkholderia dipogonis]|uniref:LysR family transcriptional regulator n=1 Tax=Paraburkholderia dipogonis TaxID=1211383 RepID=A0A4Y8MGC8_9BURK|nr:LysR family transcriptional regulator [Paraburkholderia dipogonis]TFE36497.1 LysR family transcriptional regulator [Paraburkholderia dipogonis]
MDWTDRLRLRNLQMLLSLARTGNMSHSADELHTTQPGLSKWLKELEEDVGLPLFERRARGIRPTIYGEALVDHARRIVAHLDKARDDMAVMRAGGAGIVTLGIAGASSVDTVVPMAVLRVLENLPTVHVSIEENAVETLREKLSSGQLDIVVGRTGIDFQNPDIRSEILYVEPIHIVARINHPVFKIKKPTWEQISGYGWALWAKGTPVRTAFDLAIAESGKNLPGNFVESNSATLNTSLLTGSNLIGVASHRPALRLNRMQILGIIDFPLSVVGSVTMYWREDAVARSAVRAALDGLRQAVVGTGKGGEEIHVRDGAIST